MYVWDEVVGRHEKRMTKLSRRHQIALCVASVDSAFLRTEDYLAEKVPKKSLAIIKETIEYLWKFLQGKPDLAFTKKHVLHVREMSPGEDDPPLTRGWGEIVDATLRASDMAMGENPKDLILDCVSYAYQAVLEMVVKTRGPARSTEKDLRNVEMKSEICQAEMKFQLKCLTELENGRSVQSRLFPKYRYPAE